MSTTESGKAITLVALYRPVDFGKPAPLPVGTTVSVGRKGRDGLYHCKHRSESYYASEDELLFPRRKTERVRIILDHRA